jgi:hypothetical protein
MIAAIAWIPRREHSSTPTESAAAARRARQGAASSRPPEGMTTSAGFLYYRRRQDAAARRRAKGFLSLLVATFDRRSACRCHRPNRPRTKSHNHCAELLIDGVRVSVGDSRLGVSSHNWRGRFWLLTEFTPASGNVALGQAWAVKVGGRSGGGGPVARQCSVPQYRF